MSKLCERKREGQRRTETVRLMTHTTETANVQSEMYLRISDPGTSGTIAS